MDTRNAYRKRASAGGKLIEYDEFYPRKSLNIIYKIDELISDIFEFTIEETNFLKTYDINFRTNKK